MIKKNEDFQQYKFNKLGICENPDAVIDFTGKVISYQITICRNRVGWSCGYHYGISQSNHLSMKGAGAGKNSASPTKDIAIMYQCEEILKWITETIADGDPVLKKGLIELKALKDLILSIDPNYRSTFLTPYAIQETTLDNSPNNIEMATKKPTGQGVNALLQPEQSSPKIEAEAEFKNIPLKEIQADPNQPRTFYDEAAMDELTVSIREKGVIQPILVRPSKKGFMIVCGERRFRASVSVAGAIKTRNTIPAIIRDITDEEALELQIIENLQRKDVHPMEEAVAFKSLMERKDWKVEEIAARVGKSDFFVRQRLKLNDLTPQWQTAFFHNVMTLADALKVARFPFADQQEIYSDNRVENEKELELNEWALRKYRGDLAKPPFDITNPKLSPEFGSCIGCKYNTATGALFPDDVKSPRCTYIKDFTLKADNSYKIKLAEAKEDPTVLLVNTSYGGSEAMNKLQKEGLTVLKPHDDYESIDAPDKPDFEEFKENYYDDDESEEAIQKAFESELKEYEKDLEDYRSKVSSGKYRRAFAVDGDEAGREIFIKLKKGVSPSAAGPGDKVPEGVQADLAAIETEIAGIKQRTKRAAELDEEKVYNKIRAEVYAKSDMIKQGPATATDNAATLHAIEKAMGYSGAEHMKQVFGTTDKKKLSAIYLKASADQIAIVSRLFTLHTMNNVFSSYESRWQDALRAQANQHFREEIKAIDDQQKTIRDKREKRADDRLKALQIKKKELINPKKKKDD
ncbi:MAG: ParB/RepB/Spo0J family partition protein [Ferruginibacter sp.]